MTAITAITRME